jgi:hypothetical protein
MSGGYVKKIGRPAENHKNVTSKRETQNAKPFLHSSPTAHAHIPRHPLPGLYYYLNYFLSLINSYLYIYTTIEVGERGYQRIQSLLSSRLGHLSLNHSRINRYLAFKAKIATYWCLRQYEWRYMACWPGCGCLLCDIHIACRWHEEV